MSTNANDRRDTFDPSRRDVLRMGAGAGAGAVIANGLGAGPAAASTPKQGGTLRVGSQLDTGLSNDPGTFGTSGNTLGMFGGVYNCMTEIAPNGELVGEIAESWEPSPDAKRFVFKVRQGVEFHNGKTLDADDVVASINYHREEANGSAAFAIVEQIVDMRADGKETVIVEVGEGNADLPYILSDYHLVIGPQSESAIDWEAAVGTGGYTLGAVEPGVIMEFERFPNYWKEGRAHFDSCHLIGAADQTARSNALVTDAVDVIDGIDFKIVEVLARNDGVAIDEVTGTQHFTMPMFTDTAPFDDNNVRLALKYAIDRQSVVNTILRGHGVPGNDHPITPANRYYAHDLPIREYDPDKAKHHLRQAGFETLQVDLSAADAAFPGAVDTAVLFKEQVAAAGIDIKVVREPDDGYWSNVWTKKPFVMAFWGGRPTEDWMFSMVYAKEAQWNDTHWDHEQFNALLVQARSELDEGKRKSMYREMQAMVRDEGGAIIPMYANYVFARSSEVARGEQISKSWELDGWKCIERWWFA